MPTGTGFLHLDRSLFRGVPPHYRDGELTRGTSCREPAEDHHTIILFRRREFTFRLPVPKKRYYCNYTNAHGQHDEDEYQGRVVLENIKIHDVPPFFSAMLLLD